MTVDVHPNTVADARHRGGSPAEDRPDTVADVLDRPELGYGEGDPLGPCDTYEGYPTAEELSNPKWGTFVSELFAHPLIGGYEDAVDELTEAGDTASLKKWRNALENAARAFDVDAPELFQQGREQREGDREDRLTALLGYEPPEDVVDAENPIMVAELYTLGLSVAEIADLLADHAEGDMRAAQVRDTLRTVGFLEGPTRDAQRETVEENDARLGGVSMDFSETEQRNPGVDISTEKVESDPNISVE
jgi:hypothetical protein